MQESSNVHLPWPIRLAGSIAAGLLVIAVILNIANVIGRYVFRRPITWAEEVMIFLMIGLVFIGLTPVSWAGKHIKMDIIVDHFPPKLRSIVVVLTEFATAAAMLIIVSYSIPVITRLAEFGQVSEASGIPTALPQSVIPIGLGLVAIISAIRAVIILLRGDRAFNAVHIRDDEIDSVVATNETSNADASEVSR